MNTLTRLNAPQIRRDQMDRIIAWASFTVSILLLCAVIGLGFILPRAISHAMHNTAIASPL